jgi:hypothetical protein
MNILGYFLLGCIFGSLLIISFELASIHETLKKVKNIE